MSRQTRNGSKKKGSCPTYQLFKEPRVTLERMKVMEELIRDNSNSGIIVSTKCRRKSPHTEPTMDLKSNSNGQNERRNRKLHRPKKILKPSVTTKLKEKPIPEDMESPRPTTCTTTSNYQEKQLKLIAAQRQIREYIVAVNTLRDRIKAVAVEIRTEKQKGIEKELALRQQISLLTTSISELECENKELESELIIKPFKQEIKFEILLDVEEGEIVPVD